MARRLFPRLRRLAAPRALDRRSVLLGAGAMGLFSCVKRVSRRADSAGPRVAVVGAGLAGLSCTSRLLTNDVPVTLFEANSRVGGRTFTDRSTFPGRTVELGGEFVDSWHDHLRGLLSSLDLDLEDTWEDDDVSELIGVLHGDILTEEELEVFEGRMKETVERALPKAFDPTLVTFRSNDALARSLDALSASEWLDRVGIARDRVRAAFEAGFVSLYGGGLDEASALVLLQELIGSGPDSDERYVVKGGVGQVSERLVARFPQGVLQLEHQLTRVTRRADGAVELTLAANGAEKVEVFDAVVLTLPFSVLREVKLELPLSEAKTKAIAALQMGAASKLCVEFEGKPWRALESAGAVLSDTSFPYCWDATRMQPVENGVITFFTGGIEGRLLSQVDLNVERAGALEVFNRVFPGTRAAAQPRTVAVAWASEPWARGGYALYAPGQVTAFRGVEGEPEGNVFFAGEHTSLEAQGSMEGAVRSGVRAAREVLSSLG